MSKLTKAEKETLQALAELGRRKGHTAYEVTKKRLSLRSPEPEYSQLFYRATEWKLYGGLRHLGLVEVIPFREVSRAGPKMRLIITGVVFRITKAGQAAVRESPYEHKIRWTFISSTGYIPGGSLGGAMGFEYDKKRIEELANMFDGEVIELDELILNIQNQ